MESPRARRRVGDPEKHDGNALVALFDALGFSDEVLTKWNDPGARVLHRALSIRDGDYLKDHGKVHICSGHGEGEIPEEEWVYRPFFVGDTILLTTAMSDPVTDREVFLAFAAIAFNYRYVLGCALEHGFLLRGAVEIGRAYWDTHGLLGPAPTSAHVVESRIAQTGRVVLGPMLLNVLHSWVVSERQALQERVRTMLSVCHRCEDGLIALDPAAFAASEPDKCAQNLVALKRLQAATVNRKAAAKYDWAISRFLEPSARAWPSNDDVRAAYVRIMGKDPPHIALNPHAFPSAASTGAG